MINEENINILDVTDTAKKIPETETGETYEITRKIMYEILPREKIYDFQSLPENTIFLSNGAYVKTECFKTLTDSPTISRTLIAHEIAAELVNILTSSYTSMKHNTPSELNDFQNALLWKLRYDLIKNVLHGHKPNQSISIKTDNIIRNEMKKGGIHSSPVWFTLDDAIKEKKCKFVYDGYNNPYEFTQDCIYSDVPLSLSKLFGLDENMKKENVKIHLSGDYASVSIYNLPSYFCEAIEEIYTDALFRYDLEENDND